MKFLGHSWVSFATEKDFWLFHIIELSILCAWWVTKWFELIKVPWVHFPGGALLAPPHVKSFFISNFQNIGIILFKEHIFKNESWNQTSCSCLSLLFWLYLSKDVFKNLIPCFRLLNFYLEHPLGSKPYKRRKLIENYKVFP